jgi:hypothetical protein
MYYPANRRGGGKMILLLFNLISFPGLPIGGPEPGRPPKSVKSDSVPPTQYTYILYMYNRTTYFKWAQLYLHIFVLKLIFDADIF